MREDQLSPENALKDSIVGENEHYLSDFIKHQNASDLLKHCSHAVLLRAKEISAKDKLKRSNDTESKELQKLSKIFHLTEMEQEIDF